MKNNIQKKGISLIVLIITIIVMIILAATIIISLSNNGIISKANEAVDKTNEKQVQELASLAWADAYAENVGKSNEELLQALKTSVEKALNDNNLNKEDYGIEVTTTGVTIVKGWLQTVDRTVVKGNTVLNIGDSISYDETKGGTITGLTDVEWKVLGAENGELLILSTSSIANQSFGYESTTEEILEAYANAISILNNLCVPYGQGENATGARSIKMEDILKIIDYDKTTYGKGTVRENGNIITIKYNGTLYPSYECSNGADEGTFSYEHKKGFYWYDETDGWKSVSADDLESNTEGVITTITSNLFHFTGEDYDLSNYPIALELLRDIKNCYSVTRYSSVAYDNDGNNCSVIWGLMYLSDGDVETFRVDSRGYRAKSDLSVYAVVSLSSDYNP